MKTLGDAMKQVGLLVLTDHAKERIRQRVGIISESVAVSWVSDVISQATETKRDGNKTHYITDTFEIICDGVRVVTVKPAEQANQYFGMFRELLTKEASKLLTAYKRELRKAEIAVAEAQLNLLKARNPHTKERIKTKLTDAIDYKALVEDEIKKIELAAKRFGVEAAK
ncbi:hypothetical protein NSQ61_02840 [Aeribacillus sp. FSL K6-1121]|uniref:hypothetical protein n=1 Tax=Aeribacillus sp. FSL K6-1121 TaxID=2954745 RepID=UPI0030FAD6AC